MAPCRNCGWPWLLMREQWIFRYLLLLKFTSHSLHILYTWSNFDIFWQLSGMFQVFMELAQISASEGKTIITWHTKFRLTWWRLAILFEERAVSNTKASLLWLDRVGLWISSYYKHSNPHNLNNTSSCVRYQKWYFSFFHFRGLLW